MDVAYNQHAVRRKSRSSTNLHHLSLAPLTTKLPVDSEDDQGDELFPTNYDQFSSSHRNYSTSYLQGKSAPATPRFLSRSPAGGALTPGPRSSHTRGKSAPAPQGPPRSKSASHLAATPRAGSSRRGGSINNATRQSLSLTTSPTTHRHRNNPLRPESDATDWLLRAGALISTETRESKGQAWLVSRASSTSLAGMPLDADEEALERELARERAQQSRRSSRRSSIVLANAAADIGGHDGHQHGHNHNFSNYSLSPTQSRLGSRSQSRARATFTPSARSVDGGSYFPQQMTSAEDEHHQEEEEYIPGPDFVNLDEKLETLDLSDREDEAAAAAAITNILEEEAHVRRLVKRGLVGSWFGSVLGVQLFSVKEIDEEDDDDDDHSGSEDLDGDEADEEDYDGESGAATPTTVSSTVEGVLKSRRQQQLERLITTDEKMPPPKADEGGWHDAAWLLSVASKVLL